MATGTGGAAARPGNDRRAPDRWLLLLFGTSGDLGYLRRLIAEEGFAADVLSSATLSRDGWEVEYLTHRLVP